MSFVPPIILQRFLSTTPGKIVGSFLCTRKKAIVKKESLRKWTRSSVWSLQCAIDLGLVTESTLFSKTPKKYSHEVTNKSSRRMKEKKITVKQDSSKNSVLQVRRKYVENYRVQEEFHSKNSKIPKLGEFSENSSLEYGNYLQFRNSNGSRNTWGSLRRKNPLETEGFYRKYEKVFTNERVGCTSLGIEDHRSDYLPIFDDATCRDYFEMREKLANFHSGNRQPFHGFQDNSFYGTSVFQNIYENCNTPSRGDERYFGCSKEPLNRKDPFKLDFSLPMTEKNCDNFVNPCVRNSPIRGRNFRPAVPGNSLHNSENLGESFSNFHDCYSRNVSEEALNYAVDNEKMFEHSFDIEKLFSSLQKNEHVELKERKLSSKRRQNEEEKEMKLKKKSYDKEKSVTSRKFSNIRNVEKMKIIENSRKKSNSRMETKSSAPSGSHGKIVHTKGSRRQQVSKSKVNIKLNIRRFRSSSERNHRMNMRCNKKKAPRETESDNGREKGYQRKDVEHSEEDDKGENVVRKKRVTSTDALFDSLFDRRTQQIFENLVKQQDSKMKFTRGVIKAKEEEESATKNSYKVGKLVWGYCSGWWPALIINAVDAGMLSTSGKVWAYWISDDQISELNEVTQVEEFSKSRLLTLVADKSKEKSKTAVTVLKILSKRFHKPLTIPFTKWVEKNCDTQELTNLIFYPYPDDVQRRLDELQAVNKKAREDYLLQQSRLSKHVEEKSVNNKMDNEKTVRPEQLLLRDQNIGVIAWSRMWGCNWWPVMLVSWEDCGMTDKFGCQWVMWYGEYTLSQIHYKDFLRFEDGLEIMQEYVKRSKKKCYREGVLQATIDYCMKKGYDTSGFNIDNVWEQFSKVKMQGNDETVPKLVEPYSTVIKEHLTKLKTEQKTCVDRERKIRNSGLLEKVIAGEVDVKSFCINCFEINGEELSENPFFEASLCKTCLDEFIPSCFVYGDDATCFFCTLCGGDDTVVMCDAEDCPRVYCVACLRFLIAPKLYKDILVTDPWFCLLCKDEPSYLVDSLVKPRSDWKERLTRIFRFDDKRVNVDDSLIKSVGPKRKIRVLSLFDGIGTGLLILDNLNIQVEAYYTSEIDPTAEMVTCARFGNRLTRLGDIRGITKEMIEEIAPIDLLLGGSPCNDLSLANPQRLGLYDKNGTGVLFFEYCRVKTLLEEANKGCHLLWLFENVASMPTNCRLEINKYLGREPDLINAADFSPQHRARLYWNNLPNSGYKLSPQSLQDVLTPNCDRFALVKKINTVTTKRNSLNQGKSQLKPILMNNKSDSIWITELEEIFGFPRHYTDIQNLCATKRQELIGKAWSVQTVKAIMSPLQKLFLTNDSKSPKKDS